MVKTAVHVTTVGEWNSVLNVWFKQGKTWVNGDKGYSEDLFEHGGRYLFLGNYITWSKDYRPDTPSIEYPDFMSLRKESGKKVVAFLPIDGFYI